MAEASTGPVEQPELRPSAPHRDGPLGSSGAAPERPDAAPERPKAASERRDVTPENPDATSGTSGTAGETAGGPLEAGGAPPQNPGTAADTPGAAAEGPGAAHETPGAAADHPAPRSWTAGTDESDAKSQKGNHNSKIGGTDGRADGGGGGGKLEPRVGRVLRRANPVSLARTAGRRTSAWARRPTGRVAVPAIIGTLLVALAGTAGAYLVPKALQAGATPSATPPLDAAAPGLPVPSGPVIVPSLPAGSGVPTASSAPGQTGGRPADALAGWAQQAGTRAGIPVVAVEAYGYAELVLARTAPTCHLAWTTLAALGEVESAHGSAGGAVLGADGSVQPPIFGLPLDGKGGRQLIRDTDQGTIDGITTYDRAVGPMQFIPSTWRTNAVDADNNGVADPNDIDDAALTAASYLCKNGRDLAKPDAWWDAILSYNAVRPYAQRVFDAANTYGERSRV